MSACIVAISFLILGAANPLHGQVSTSSSRPFRILDSEYVTLGGEGAGLMWRVNGLERLPDGRFVVLNSGTGELLFFSSAGDLDQRVGRLGQGPGEMQSPASMDVDDDGNLVVQEAQGRKIVYSPDGEFLESRRFVRPEILPDGAESFTVLYPIGRDRVVVRERFIGVVTDDLGSVRSPLHFTVIDHEGNVGAHLGESRGVGQQLVDVGSRNMPVVPPFSRYSVFSINAHTRFAAYGDTGSDHLTFIKLTQDWEVGERTSVPVPTVGKPIDRSDIRAWEERLRNADWGDTSLLEQMASALPRIQHHTVAPAFDYPLIISDAGNVFVSEYVEDLSAARSLMAFSRDGDYLGHIEVPGGLTKGNVVLLDDEYFAAVFLDELDEEEVRVYRLKSSNQ